MKVGEIGKVAAIANFAGDSSLSWTFDTDEKAEISEIFMIGDKAPSPTSTASLSVSAPSWYARDSGL